MFTAAADVFSADLESYFAGASAVMSCLGGFGTNEQMVRICGDATVRAAEAAKNAGTLDVSVPAASRVSLFFLLCLCSSP